MKLTLNEKTCLDSALNRLENFVLKLDFSDIEADTAKRAVVNFHTLLVDQQSEGQNSRYEKTVKGENGRTLTIVGISSSQQGIFSRIFRL
jgi:hypothetical protein